MAVLHTPTATRAWPAFPLSFLRARPWLHFLPLTAAGIDASQEAWSRSAPRAGCAAVAAACMFAYGYGLNAVVDRRMDHDVAKNPLAGVHECPRHVAAMLASLAALALLISVGLGRLTIVAATVSLLASTLYSAGLRLKARPGVGTLLNVAIFAPAMWLAVVPGHAPASLVAMLVAFSAMLVQNQLLHERADLVEDAAGGVRSTASLLSPVQTVAVAWVVGACGLLATASVASSARLAWAAACGFFATGVAATVPLSWPRRRRVHRWVSAIAGAGLYASCWA